MADSDLLDDVLKLAQLLKPRWPVMRARLRATGVPTCLDAEEESTEDETTESEEESTEDETTESEEESTEDETTESEEEKKPNWKALSRRHERAAKKNAEALKKKEGELAAIAEKNKTERDKEIEKAKKEGKSESDAENLKHRRQDRLESTITRLASSGVPVETGEGDDAKTEQVKFADAADALVYIRGAIVSGDLDEKDLFEDDTATVNEDVLIEHMAELLTKKQHLRAAGKSRTDPKGNDAGKGKGGAKALEDMSVEEHLKRIQSAAK